VGRIKVLLVDDVELFLELEKTFFRHGEYTVLTARTGQAALDSVRSERPQAVFLDLYLPDLNGDDICRQIKQDPDLGHIPVIMVTQSGRELDLERCRQAGCDEILLKPVNRHQFLEAARRLIHVTERHSPRVRVALGVQLRADGLVLDNPLVNLSTGGMFVETDLLQPVNTLLQVQLVLDDDAEPVRCQGRVAWVNHPEWVKKEQLPIGMGVQFQALSLADLDRIRHFIKQLALAGTSS
jgi:uncharacterized protein (TIGR02266 family)